MLDRNGVRVALAAVVALSISAGAMAATSAEINPFASTQSQVDARLARVQQEVDRLRTAGMFSAATDLSKRLSHFHLELAGLEPSQIAGPELDAIGIYTANGDTAIVEVHPTDRPVVLSLSAYELVHWQLIMYPGANLQKVIVSGYDGAAAPGGVPAGVPVQVTSHATDGGNYFYFYSKSESTFAESARTMYQLTGLPPSTMQGQSSYLGQHFAVGSPTVEWTQERVLSEMQPLYNDATAFQLAQDRTAADSYRFTGLYSTYRADGSKQSTHVAQMTPLRGIDGTIQSASVNYKYIGVDPSGPTYYAMSSANNKPVTFNPATGQETALPTTNLLGVVSGLTFDTKRNRLVIGESAGDPPGYRFLFYNPSDGTWVRSALPGGGITTALLTYSAANDAYFSLESGANGAVKLDRFDATSFAKTQVELSQFITCGHDTCQLAASGDRLALLVPPAVDVYEPLSGPVAHSYLIDPANGNVTILGAVPEPGAVAWAFVAAAVVGRRGAPRSGRKFLSAKGAK